MHTDLLHRVFSTVQSLEQQIESVKNQYSLNSQANSKAISQLTEFERVVKSMRRVANKLQLEVAKKDSIAIVRSLKIFYGLNFMVRPEVLKTSMSLVSKQPLEVSQTALRDLVYH
jgi:di/tripeptidase